MAVPELGLHWRLRSGPSGDLTDVFGLRVGHAGDDEHGIFARSEAGVPAFVP